MSEGKGFYQAASYLGQHPNISKGLLKKTSCMGQEQREEIAVLDAIKKVYPLLDSEDALDKLDMLELIDKAIMPFLENLGFADWQRDVVTDMAIRKGDTRKKSGWKRETPEQEQGLE